MAIEKQVSDTNKNRAEMND